METTKRSSRLPSLRLSQNQETRGHLSPRVVPVVLVFRDDNQAYDRANRDAHSSDGGFASHDFWVERDSSKGVHDCFPQFTRSGIQESLGRSLPLV